jgi:DNA-directed RNA polymerase subunit RPC12/RpoP
VPVVDISVSDTAYRCDGCHAELTRKDDLQELQGTERSRWRCAYCQTTVPTVVAERLRHQRQ